MATYGTFLTTLTNAESGSWTEFTDAGSGGTPASDTENYIQGVSCFSQATGTKSGLKSVVFNAGSNQAGNFTSGDVVFAWVYYAIGVNIQTYANNGYQFGIGSTAGNVNLYTIGGSDYGRNPYGGWFNVVVDPSKTPDNIYGSGNGGAYQYFGAIVDTLAPISKGTPHAVDAIRYGRGVIFCYGSGCEFTTMAEYNDYNQSSPHPNAYFQDTDGYNRFGLFSKQGGTFLWKGQLSLGFPTEPSASVNFSDSNKTIIVDDTPAVTSTFNEIIIVNGSSTVTWDSITIFSLGTTSRGNFEMIDNAAVTKTSCTFTDMGTWIYQSNANISGTVYRRCGTVYPKGCTFTENNLFNPATSTGLIQLDAPSDITNISSCNLTNNTTNPSIRITAAGTYSFNNLQFFGTATTYVEFTGTGTCIIIPSGGSNISQAKCSATGGGTITVQAPAINVTLTGLQVNSEVRAYVGTDPATSTAIAGVENSSTSFTFSQSVGGQDGYIVIHALGYNTIYLPITYSTTEQTIPIQQTVDRNYSNP